MSAGPATEQGSTGLQLEDIIDRLGAPLNFALQLFQWNVRGVAIPDTAVFLRGQCCGLLSYDGRQKMLTFDENWPIIKMGAGLSKVFSSERDDETTLRIEAMCAHFFMRSSALVIANNDRVEGEGQQAGGGGGFGGAGGSGTSGALRRLMTSKASIGGAGGMMMGGIGTADSFIRPSDAAGASSGASLVGSRSINPSASATFGATAASGIHDPPSSAPSPTAGSIKNALPPAAHARKSMTSESIPSVVFLSHGPTTEHSDAGGTLNNIKTRFVVGRRLNDLLFELHSQKYTGLLQQYFPPRDGVHHMVRAVYTDFMLRLDARRSLIPLHEAGVPLSKRLCLSSEANLSSKSKSLASGAVSSSGQRGTKKGASSRDGQDDEDDDDDDDDDEDDDNDESAGEGHRGGGIEGGDAGRAKRHGGKHPVNERIVLAPRQHHHHHHHATTTGPQAHHSIRLEHVEALMSDLVGGIDATLEAQLGLGLDRAVVYLMDAHSDHATFLWCAQWDVSSRKADLVVHKALIRAAPAEVPSGGGRPPQPQRMITGTTPSEATSLAFRSRPQSAQSTRSRPLSAQSIRSSQRSRPGSAKAGSESRTPADHDVTQPFGNEGGRSALEGKSGNPRDQRLEEEDGEPAPSKQPQQRHGMTPAADPDPSLSILAKWNDRPISALRKRYMHALVPTSTAPPLDTTTTNAAGSQQPPQDASYLVSSGSEDPSLAEGGAAMSIRSNGSRNTDARTFASSSVLILSPSAAGGPPKKLKLTAAGVVDVKDAVDQWRHEKSKKYIPKSFLEDAVYRQQRDELAAKAAERKRQKHEEEEERRRSKAASGGGHPPLSVNRSEQERQHKQKLAKKKHHVAVSAPSPMKTRRSEVEVKGDASTNAGTNNTTTGTAAGKDAATKGAGGGTNIDVELADVDLTVPSGEVLLQYIADCEGAAQSMKQRRSQLIEAAVMKDLEARKIRNREIRVRAQLGAAGMAGRNEYDGGKKGDSTAVLGSHGGPQWDASTSVVTLKGDVSATSARRMNATGASGDQEDEAAAKSKQEATLQEFIASIVSQKEVAKMQLLTSVKSAHQRILPTAAFGVHTTVLPAETSVDWRHGSLAGYLQCNHLLSIPILHSTGVGLGSALQLFQDVPLEQLVDGLGTSPNASRSGQVDSASPMPPGARGGASKVALDTSSEEEDVMSFSDEEEMEFDYSLVGRGGSSGFGTRAHHHRRSSSRRELPPSVATLCFPLLPPFIQSLRAEKVVVPTAAEIRALRHFEARRKGMQRSAFLGIGGEDDREMAGPSTAASHIGASGQGSSISAQGNDNNNGGGSTTIGDGNMDGTLQRSDRQRRTMARPLSAARDYGQRSVSQQLMQYNRSIMPTSPATTTLAPAALPTSMLDVLCYEPAHVVDEAAAEEERLLVAQMEAQREVDRRMKEREVRIRQAKNREERGVAEAEKVRLLVEHRLRMQESQNMVARVVEIFSDVVYRAIQRSSEVRPLPKMATITLPPTISVLQQTEVKAMLTAAGFLEKWQTDPAVVTRWYECHVQEGSCPSNWKATASKKKTSVMGGQHSDHEDKDDDEEDDDDDDFVLHDADVAALEESQRLIMLQQAKLAQQAYSMTPPTDSALPRGVYGSGPVVKEVSGSGGGPEAPPLVTITAADPEDSLRDDQRPTASGGSFMEAPFSVGGPDASTAAESTTVDAEKERRRLLSLLPPYYSNGILEFTCPNDAVLMKRALALGRRYYLDACSAFSEGLSDGKNILSSSSLPRKNSNRAPLSPLLMSPKSLATAASESPGDVTFATPVVGVSLRDQIFELADQQGYTLFDAVSTVMRRHKQEQSHDASGVGGGADDWFVADTL